jgi:hypothetical protein
MSGPGFGALVRLTGLGPCSDVGLRSQKVPNEPEFRAGAGEKGTGAARAWLTAGPAQRHVGWAWWPFVEVGELLLVVVLVDAQLDAIAAVTPFRAAGGKLCRRSDSALFLR